MSRRRTNPENIYSRHAEVRQKRWGATEFLKAMADSNTGPTHPATPSYAEVVAAVNRKDLKPPKMNRRDRPRGQSRQDFSTQAREILKRAQEGFWRTKFGSQTAESREIRNVEHPMIYAPSAAGSIIFGLAGQWSLAFGIGAAAGLAIAATEALGKGEERRQRREHLKQTIRHELNEIGQRLSTSKGRALRMIFTDQELAENLKQRLIRNKLIDPNVDFNSLLETVLAADYLTLRQDEAEQEAKRWGISLRDAEAITKVTDNYLYNLIPKSQQLPNEVRQALAEYSQERAKFDAQVTAAVEILSNMEKAVDLLEREPTSIGDKVKRIFKSMSGKRILIGAIAALGFTAIEAGALALFPGIAPVAALLNITAPAVITGIRLLYNWSNKAESSWNKIVRNRQEAYHSQEVPKAQAQLKRRKRRIQQALAALYAGTTTEEKLMRWYNKYRERIPDVRLSTHDNDPRLRRVARIVERRRHEYAKRYDIIRYNIEELIEKKTDTPIVSEAARQAVINLREAAADLGINKARKVEEKRIQNALKQYFSTLALSNETKELATKYPERAEFIYDLREEHQKWALWNAARALGILNKKDINTLKEGGELAKEKTERLAALSDILNRSFFEDTPNEASLEMFESEVQRIKDSLSKQGFNKEQLNRIEPFLRRYRAYEQRIGELKEQLKQQPPQGDTDAKRNEKIDTELRRVQEFEAKQRETMIRIIRELGIVEEDKSHQYIEELLNTAIRAIENKAIPQQPKSRVTRIARLLCAIENYGENGDCPPTTKTERHEDVPAEIPKPKKQPEQPEELDEPLMELFNAVAEELSSLESQQNLPKIVQDYLKTQGIDPNDRQTALQHLTQIIRDQLSPEEIQKILKTINSKAEAEKPEGEPLLPYTSALAKYLLEQKAQTSRREVKAAPQPNVIQRLQVAFQNDPTVQAQLQRLQALGEEAVEQFVNRVSERYKQLKKENGKALPPTRQVVKEELGEYLRTYLTDEQRELLRQITNNVMDQIRQFTTLEESKRRSIRMAVQEYLLAERLSKEDMEREQRDALDKLARDLGIRPKNSPSITLKELQKIKHIPSIEKQLADSPETRDLLLQYYMEEIKTIKKNSAPHGSATREIKGGKLREIERDAHLPEETKREAFQKALERLKNDNSRLIKLVGILDEAASEFGIRISLATRLRDEKFPIGAHYVLNPKTSLDDIRRVYLRAQELQREGSVTPVKDAVREVFGIDTLGILPEEAIPVPEENQQNHQK